MPRPGRFLAFVILLTFPVALSAQLSDSDRSRLLDGIQTSAGRLDADLLPEFDASRLEFLAQVETVRQYLAANTSAENRDAWLEYLDLEPLVEACQSEESTPAMAREAIDLRDRLIDITPGLELTVLLELRDATGQLIESIRFRDRERSIQLIGKQLQSLAQRVEELEASPSADDFAVISAALGILDSAGQARELVRSFRNTFNRSNVSIWVNESLVRKAVNRPVSRTTPVRDCILGTRIVGTSTMNGLASADLLPSIGAAKVLLMLAGQVETRNRGFNRPVHVRTNSHGNLNVSRIMTINESGITLQQVQATAALNTRITGVEHNLGIVRMFARKQAEQQKPQANRIAVRKMRIQAADRFETDTRAAAAGMPSDPLADFRPVLARLSLEEPTQLWSSTNDAIVVDGWLRRHDQMSTVVSRPPITEPYEVAIQIHESAIGNALTTVLSGRTLSESRLNELLEMAGQSSPNTETALATEAEEDQPGEPPFEIDFSRLRPVIFEARDQTVRLGVRGTRFAQGSRELKQAMEITATYVPAYTGDGNAILLRQGDVEVNFPGRTRLTISQAGLRRTIEKKFASLFPETLLTRQFDIPSDAKIKSLRGHIFRSRWIDAQDGWLTVAAR